MLRIELSAVVLALEDGEGTNLPQTLVLTTQNEKGEVALPSGPFDPNRYPTLELCLRAWVDALTGMELGYVEQLYTFGDRQRSRTSSTIDHTITIGYLALARHNTDLEGNVQWRRCNWFFPWEDTRDERYMESYEHARKQLHLWSQRKEKERLARLARIRRLFNDKSELWHEDLTLERYELLYEARLVAESFRDAGEAVPTTTKKLGMSAALDHRRILATAMNRIRGKLRYRPVLFELMPDSFTLFDLQRAAEAVSGVHLHKQNFRRMALGSGLVEPTGENSSRRKGPPAATFRFSGDAVAARRLEGLAIGQPLGRHA